MQTIPKPKLEQIAIKRIENYPGRPTIIFLHDSLGCIKLWRDFPKQLGELTQCNVLIYDRQGYGASCDFSYEERTNDYMEWEADILADLMDFWNLEKAVLFGHSDGGSIALIAAGKYPERVQAVITEGAHIFVEDITIQGIEEAKKLYQSTNLHQKLEKYHGVKTAAMFSAWSNTWLSEAFQSWNIEHFLPNISCPTLVIQGLVDEYGSLKQVEGILKGIGGSAKELTIAEVKHTPHKEKQEIVLKAVHTFFSEIFINNRKSKD